MVDKTVERPTFITIAEAAKLAKVSTRTVGGWLTLGARNWTDSHGCIPNSKPSLTVWFSYFTTLKIGGRRWIELKSFTKALGLAKKM